MIPPPRNILVSYHYFKTYDLDRFAGLRVIGDSGAFSAHHQGAEITTDQLVAWAMKWRHRLCWVAALDVIGNSVATRHNWKEMVRAGIPGVPTVHFGCEPNLLDYYAGEGVDFVGLGGMVGRPPNAQMRWLVSMFKYARTNHPEMRFHGWGLTHSKALQLPFFSVDSSGWGGAYRYGRLTLRDPDTFKAHNIDLNGRGTYTPAIAKLLRDQYGVNPSEVATSGPHNRLLMVKLSALSASVQEQQFRHLHRKNPVPVPTWGRLAGQEKGPHVQLAMQDRVDRIEALTGPNIHLASSDGPVLTQVAEMNAAGPHVHLADTAPGVLRQVTDMAGPHYHLADGDKSNLRQVADMAAGPHMHLAEGSSEHLQTIAAMNGDPS